MIANDADMPNLPTIANVMDTQFKSEMEQKLNPIAILKTHWDRTWLYKYYLCHISEYFFEHKISNTILIFFSFVNLRDCVDINRGEYLWLILHVLISRHERALHCPRGGGGGGHSGTEGGRTRVTYFTEEGVIF